MPNVSGKSTWRREFFFPGQTRTDVIQLEGSLWSRTRGWWHCWWNTRPPSVDFSLGHPLPSDAVSSIHSYEAQCAPFVQNGYWPCEKFHSPLYVSCFWSCGMSIHPLHKINSLMCFLNGLSTLCWFLKPKHIFWIVRIISLRVNIALINFAEWEWFLQIQDLTHIWGDAPITFPGVFAHKWTRLEFELGTSIFNSDPLSITIFPHQESLMREPVYWPMTRPCDKYYWVTRYQWHSWSEHLI